MAESDQTLKILVKTEGDMAGLEKAKKGLEDFKGASAGASQAATILGSAIGAAIPTTFAGLMTGAISAVKAFEAAEQSLFEEMERGRIKIRGLQQSLLETQDGLLAMARIKTLPLTQQISELEQALIRLKTEQSLVNQSLEGGVEPAPRYQAQITATTAAVEALKNMQQGVVQSMLDMEAVTRAHALGSEED